MRNCILLVILISTIRVEVEGHGTLTFPAAKGYAWAEGFATPIDYNHMGKNCGGFAVQWNPPNDGKCGYCGDPHNGPFQNELNGIFNNQVIVATFSKNQIINVKVKITSAHQGYFMFEICRTTSLDLTHDCIPGVNVYPVQLTGGGYKYYGHSGSGGIAQNRVYTIQLSLPTGLWCSPRCVFKWRYRAGNSWGADADGEGLGHGAQEEFHNCANIKITDPDEGDIPAPVNITTTTTTTSTTTTTTTPAPGTGATLTCTAIDSWPDWKDEADAFCTSICNDDPSKCPEDRCLCCDDPPCSSTVCVAAGAWAGDADMAAWCVTSCAAGYCPATHCVCT